MDNDGNVNITDVTRMVSSVLNERIMTTQTSGWRIYPSNVTLNSSNYLTIAGTRNVNNAISNVTSIDFLGVKVGDTNGSW
jgi:ABC-type dipeptide/oligopeptide/nickel transport system permease subunit